MAIAAASASCTLPYASQLLPRPKSSTLAFPSSSSSSSSSFSYSSSASSGIAILGLRTQLRRYSLIRMGAARNKDSNAVPSVQGQAEQQKGEEVIEEEEDLPWIQEKALDLVEFTGSVTQAIPGPRVGSSSLPWILALPLAYAGLTFVIAFVKTVKKFTSPKEKRRRLVNKNAILCKSIDDFFHEGRENFKLDDALQGLEKKTGFGMEEILRKYIRYALNEKPFNPDLVANLIELRKASMLADSQVAEILNEISRRIVRDKGPVVMDMSGYSEKGFKRKLAVQALFGKVFYLSELPEFCSRDSSLVVKEIFGVTDDDANKLRIHTISEAGDMDSLEKMVDSSDLEDSSEESSRDS